MNVFEIPLASTPETFITSLSGVQYRLRVTWCAPAQYWVLDIFDSNGDPLILGTAMVTGQDLLGQFAYIDVAGSLIIQSDNDPFRMPTFTDLGITSHLYYLTS